MKMLLSFFAVLLPPALKPWYYRCLGYRIGKGVRVGFSVINADSVDIGDKVRIGHFNIFRRVKSLKIGNDVFIANFNEFMGNLNHGSDWQCSLNIEASAKIMSHHFFDVASTIVIGAGATIGGRGSQFWTHTVRIIDGRHNLVAVPLSIGGRSYIGARATILFCSLPERSIVGAGSVVCRSFEGEEGYILIAGNPATVRRTFPIGRQGY